MPTTGGSAITDGRLAGKTTTITLAKSTKIIDIPLIFNILPFLNQYISVMKNSSPLWLVM
jgi:hypothetical protein